MIFGAWDCSLLNEGASMGLSNTEHGCPDPHGYRCGRCEGRFVTFDDERLAALRSLPQWHLSLSTMGLHGKRFHYNEFHFTSFHDLTVSMIASSRAYFSDLESLIRGHQ